MSLKHYIIEDGVMKPASLFEWAAWFGCADRHVAETRVGPGLVSTVFMGIDMGYEPEGVREILYETMIFCTGYPEVDQDQCRYATLEAAKRGHSIHVERLREFLPESDVEERECCLGRIPPDKAAQYSIMLRELPPEN